MYTFSLFENGEKNNSFTIFHGDFKTIKETIPLMRQEAEKRYPAPNYKVKGARKVITVENVKSKNVVATYSVLKLDA